MENKIEVFTKAEFGELRTVNVGDKIMFVASDVAKALGYSRPADAITAHCKGSVKHRLPTNGGMQELKIIPEGDVYRLITHSKLPAAEKFESWVFDEVLPSIRKHGAYMTEDTIKKVIAEPDFIIKLATELKKEQEQNKQLTETCSQQQQVIGELKPKADYVDKILKSNSLVTITQIAKDYGMSGQGMNKVLHDMHIIYSCNKQWLLYSQHQAKGYTFSETVDIPREDGTTKVVMNTKWTQKGRLFLYETLKKRNLLPLIERKEQEMMLSNWENTQVCKNM